MSELTDLSNKPIYIRKNITIQKEIYDTYQWIAQVLNVPFSRLVSNVLLIYYREHSANIEKVMEAKLCNRNSVDKPEQSCLGISSQQGGKSMEGRFPRGFSLPDSIFVRLKRMSPIHQRSMSRIVELALQEYLPKLEREE